MVGVEGVGGGKDEGVGVPACTPVCSSDHCSANWPAFAMRWSMLYLRRLELGVADAGQAWLRYMG